MTVFEIIRNATLRAREAMRGRNRVSEHRPEPVWGPRIELRAARSSEEARGSFVFVADDGSVRELTKGEAEYLATGFDPGDGGRPYIKKHYDSRTPDGRLFGFLSRSEVPIGVRVREATADDDGGSE